MKSIALILPAALFLVASCSGEVTTEENMLNDLVDQVQEEMETPPEKGLTQEELKAKLSAFIGPKSNRLPSPLTQFYSHRLPPLRTAPL